MPKSNCRRAEHRRWCRTCAASPSHGPSRRDRYVAITCARNSRSVMPSRPPLRPSSQVSVSCVLAVVVRRDPELRNLASRRWRAASAAGTGTPAPPPSPSAPAAPSRRTPAPTAVRAPAVGVTAIQSPGVSDRSSATTRTATASAGILARGNRRLRHDGIGPEVVGHQPARGHRSAVRARTRVLQFDGLTVGVPVEHAVAGDGARGGDHHQRMRVVRLEAVDTMPRPVVLCCLRALDVACPPPEPARGRGRTGSGDRRPVDAWAS